MIVLFNTILEVLVTASREGKEGGRINKRRIKFSDDTIVYLGSPKE